MIFNGKRFCDFCGREIVPPKKYVQFRKPGRDGKHDEDFELYHHQGDESDCWMKQIQREQEQIQREREKRNVA